MATPTPARPDEPQGTGPATPPAKSKRNTVIVIVIVVVVVVVVGPLVTGAVLNKGKANPAPAGFAAAIAGGWKHGETLGATNLVTDTDRQDLCIVAGRIVGGPYDGQVAAWGVSPCSAVGNIGGPGGSAVVIAANSVATATNRNGDSVPDSAPIAAFRTDLAVQDAIDGVG